MHHTLIKITGGIICEICGDQFAARQTKMYSADFFDYYLILKYNIFAK